MKVFIGLLLLFAVARAQDYLDFPQEDGLDEIAAELSDEVSTEEPSEATFDYYGSPGYRSFYGSSRFYYPYGRYYYPYGRHYYPYGRYPSAPMEQRPYRCTWQKFGYKCQYESNAVKPGKTEEKPEKKDVDEEIEGEVLERVAREAPEFDEKMMADEPAEAGLLGWKLDKYHALKSHFYGNRFYYPHGRYYYPYGRYYYPRTYRTYGYPYRRHYGPF